MRTLSVAAMLLVATMAEARVVRLVVEQRQPMPGGQYEKLTGRIVGELDPGDAHNTLINDIRLAQKNSRGKVEYSATFTLLKPVDAAKMRGVLLYEVPNRGNSPLNGRLSPDDINAGNVLLSSGWQGDVEQRAPLESITVPVARKADGSSIIGPVLARLMNLPAGSNTALLTGGFTGLRYQKPATLDTANALLTKQASDDGQQITIAPADWAFADCTKTPFPGVADATRICVKAGFAVDQLYQVTYTAKDPLVLGTGLGATRDIVSFFRYTAKDDDGAANPVAGRIRYSIGEGTSQSGNFLRTMIHLGFNEDETRRMVWDAINPNIAARQNPLNFRFAIPGGATGLYEPGSEGALWWGEYKDTLRVRPAASLLDRCRATNSCPKVMETFGSSEFWGLRMSPNLVGTAADRDIPLPADVRRYSFPGVTHNGGRGGFTAGAAAAGNGGCALPDNPNPSFDTMRALHLALVDWVTKGTEPPESRYPRLDRGELVMPTRLAMGFPAIPGWPLPDNILNRMLVYDFGKEFRDTDLSGAISIQPPIVTLTIPMLAPRTDADGNEVDGVASTLHQAPLGTYTGWNITAAGYLKGRVCGFAGGYIPFAVTKADRLASGDPRPSLEERYRSHDVYVSRVKDASRRLVAQRFLVQEDADRLVHEAEGSNILR